VGPSIHWVLQAAGTGGLESLSAAERARLGGLRVEKRRADFLLGRWTAKAVCAAALREALSGEWPPAAIELPAEPGGAPYARLAAEAGARAGFAPRDRLPVRITISHAEGHALCAAAAIQPGDDRALGIDLGRIEPRSAALQATFFTTGERRWVGEAPAGDAELRANLVWCSKEAVLKALGLGLVVDTLAVECRPEEALADPGEWPLAPPDGTWRRFTARCAPALLPGAGAVHGIWRVLEGSGGARFVGALAIAPAR
jgi:4'-phosphopantetheinyl transferase